MSTASPVTTMPSSMRRLRRTVANQSVGFPLEMPSGVGDAPSGMDPAIVSAVSPGRCSGHTREGEPAGPVITRLTIGRPSARAWMLTSAGAPAVDAGVTVTTVRFSARFNAPKSEPVV